MRKKDRGRVGGDAPDLLDDENLAGCKVSCVFDPVRIVCTRWSAINVVQNYYQRLLGHLVSIDIAREKLPFQKFESLPDAAMSFFLFSFFLFSFVSLFVGNGLLE